jgi:hypothetical protein
VTVAPAPVLNQTQPMAGCTGRLGDVAHDQLSLDRAEGLVDVAEHPSPGGAVDRQGCDAHHGSERTQGPLWAVSSTAAAMIAFICSSSWARNDRSKPVALNGHRSSWWSMVLR